MKGGGLGGLKGLVASARAKAAEERGGRRFVSKGDLRKERAQKELEEREREVKRRRGNEDDVDGGEASDGTRRAEDVGGNPEEKGTPGRTLHGDGEGVDIETDDSGVMLGEEEVKRLLRELGQPITFYGEDAAARCRRLARAKREVKVEDDVKGGQQENEMRAFMEAAETVGDDATKSKGAPNLQEQFAAAAARLARQLASEREGGTGASIIAYFQRLEEEWSDELSGRSENVKRSQDGRQATAFFRETTKYLKILYERLQADTVPDDLLKGIFLIMEAMKERNYLHATDVYVRIAIGNAPWPIGVTSVGIHDRSAREKISHTFNTESTAHIMNDEGTRKWLQAVKRLLTFCQHRYPTDPSRCVNFNAQRAAGFGQSDLNALQAASARGETVERLALPAAPHHHDHDGSVKPPATWKAMLNQADRKLKKSIQEKS